MFLFAPTQSAFAQDLMSTYEIDKLDSETFLLVKNQQSFVFSSAALEVAKDLSGLWCIVSIFRFVPRPVRDFVYKVFARNRYRLFGKRDVCMVPTQEFKSRFVGV